MPGKTLQIFLKGLKNQTNIIRIKENASIALLRQKVCELSGVNDKELRVLYASRDLRSENEDGDAMYLDDYNISDLANIFMVLRLPGGSDDSKTVQVKMYDSEVKLTDKPDMFTLEDDVGGQRAEMPCGHVIGPESLTAYCRSLLDAKRYEFRCPYKKNHDDPFCDTLWELFTVRRLAVLTPQEEKEFEIKITENYLRKAVGIQECPKCMSFCERRSKKTVRVVCLVCTKRGKVYEFCWCCLKTWLNQNDVKVCGNLSCTGKDPRLRIVQDCPKKRVIGVPNCPAVRMCPTCGMLIEHKEACKQMVCTCGQRFCFICLKKATVRGAYKCGAWDFPCAVAPIQSTVPGD